MAKVFTPQVVESIRVQFEAQPEEKWRLLYTIASDERGRAIRDRIEVWAASLSARALTRVTRKLRDAEQFRSAYGELLTMYWLGQRGFRFDYESTLPNGQTPDLLVHESAHGPSFICEVYTEHLSSEMKARHQNLRELRRGLNAIPLDYGLRLRGDHSWHDRDDLNISRVVQEVHAWLECKPQIGEEREIGFLLVSVMSVGRGFKSVASMGPPIAWCVDAGRPWGKMREKVCKYAAVAKQKKLPLVLAYVTEFAMGTSADTIETAAEGAEGDEGLFETASPAFSGVLAVSETDGCIDVDVFLNPHALNPLPDGMFEPS
jgi:hypothetical protein